MGALIMLLVLIARNVQEQNTVLAAVVEQPVETETEKETEPLPTPEQVEELFQTLKTETEDVDWMAEELTKSKKLAEDKLTDERAKLAAVEKETQKIRDELVRLETIVKELDANTSATPQQRDDLKQLLDQKKALRAQAETELEKLQDEAKRNSKSYAIIPYRGTGGTYRRPIYIECSKDKMIIQPEGVVLYGIDFEAPERADNPVDAALRVVRQYYQETGQLPKGTEPYPLLIVRPSGVDVYGAARASMGSWVNEYGYELVDEDWNVEYPPPSQELKERIEKQLEVARDRIAAYLAVMEMQRKTAERTQKFRVDSKGLVQRIEPPGGFSSTPGIPGRRARTFSADGGSPDGVASGPTNGAPGTMPNGVPNGVPSGGEPFVVHDRERNGILTPGRPSPSESILSLERNAQTAPPYASQPSYTTAGAQKKEDDLISLDVPDPSKQEKPMLYPAGTEPQAQQAGTDATGQFSKPSTSTGSTAGQPGKPGSQPGGQPGGQPGQPPLGMKSSPNDTRGENWALRGAKRNAIGVTRNIKIQIEAERFVLVQQPGLMFAQVIPIGNSVALATDSMVETINEFTESWGIAGENMYWKPTLKVKVQPGGEENFNDFKLLLRGSGMVVEEEIGVRR